VNRASAEALLGRLQDAQNHFYGGGDSAGLREVLSPDVTWTIPGSNAIAGTYRGLDAVLDYFTRRRAIANSTFRLHRRDVLVGAGSAIAALTDGTAIIAGQRRDWSTVGLYEVHDGLVAACWLLPLDAAQFDAIWA
jgi:ketosteroid isomerase-like protein